MKEKRLSELRVGEVARVQDMRAAGAIRRRFLDVGLVEDTQVECVGFSPGGDMSACLIRGAVIGIRLEDAGEVSVEVRDMEGRKANG